VRALDSIYVRGHVQLLDVARGDTELARRASDHRPLYADVVITAHHHAHHGDGNPPKRARTATQSGHTDGGA
jgi:hypothetical protein